MTLLLVLFLDLSSWLAQPAQTFLGKVLWVLEGYSQYITEPSVKERPRETHHYWASACSTRPIAR